MDSALEVVGAGQHRHGKGAKKAPPESLAGLCRRDYVTFVMQKRVGFPENRVEHFAEKGREPCSVARWHRQNLTDTNLWGLQCSPIQPGR